jgi:mono/diheme cytochrome c family protein
MRSVFAALAALTAILSLAACGQESIEVDSADAQGAELFAERCSGCHSLDAAGSLGSANRALRNQGPNLNQRIESSEDVLYAIRNGGFSGAIMPQQIVVGEDAQAVADFVAKYAGQDINRPTRPSAGPNDVAVGSAAENPDE